MILINSDGNGLYITWFAVSYIFNLSSGATIVMVLAAAFLISYYFND